MTVNVIFDQDTFAKLHVWNMTQYKTVLWLDSDMMVVKSLAPLLAKADQLQSPSSAAPGARIGVSYDFNWWWYIAEHGKEAEAGSWWDSFNSGVFLIRPGTVPEL